MLAAVNGKDFAKGISMITVRPLPEALGAEVRDVDLAAPCDGELFAGLLDAFFTHHVMIVPGQSLAPGQFAGLARIFGRPKPHVLTHLHHPDYPEILPLSNILEDGEPIGVYEGAAYWHTDMSYEAEPGSSTLVYAIQVPEVGGETSFANMARAYEALPDATKRRIDGLTVLHHYGNRDDLDDDSPTSAEPLRGEQKQQVENVFHPLVLRHPVTGVKALYGVSGSSFGIVGMPDDEAIALLDELKAHATGEAFIYRHRYAVGDLVVWDNLATLHAAARIPPATGPADTRLLHRISVKGAPELSA